MNRIHREFPAHQRLSALFSVPTPIFIVSPTGNVVEFFDLLILLQQTGPQYITDGEHTDLPAVLLNHEMTDKQTQKFFLEF